MRGPRFLDTTDRRAVVYPATNGARSLVVEPTSTNADRVARTYE